MQISTAIYIGGQTATPVYKLMLAKSGAGTVLASPAQVDSFYDVGTTVTLTASPSTGSMFYRWSGTDQSTSNPYVVTMNSHKTEIAVMPASPGFGTFPYEASPKGFASVGAFTYPSGTTGGSGSGSQKVYVTNSDDLANLMLRRVDASHTLNFPPLIVYIIGTLTTGTVVTDMCDVKDAYDISIIGVGVDAKLSGFGLNIVRSKNIIVRNLKVENSPIDGFTIQANDVDGTGNHIWIDHCDITNCYDGALDPTHTVSYMTASWNHFYKHEKTCLQGHSNSQTSDVTMKVTWHHNFFDSTGQRHPRVRFGKAHVYNNYYKKNTLYGVSSNKEADVVVEGSYFLDVTLPMDTCRDGDSTPGDVVERNNIFVNCGVPQTRGTSFDPSTYYSYSLDSAASIPAMLEAYAGSGKYDFSSNETPVQYQIVSSAGAHGSITPMGTTFVTSGGSQSYTILPNTGYRVAKVLVDGDSVGTMISYDFTNVTTNHTISVTFAVTEQSTSIAMSTGWNLVSIPRILLNYQPGYVFPHKSGSIYAYNTSARLYNTALILANGPGYWVNNSITDTTIISGSAPGSLTDTAAQAGWVLIGSRDTSIQISSLVFSDGADEIGSVFRYDASPGQRQYVKTTVINPGEAVWINVQGATSWPCTITIP